MNSKQYMDPVIFFDSALTYRCFRSALCCHWASGISGAGATAGPGMSAHLSVVRLFSLPPAALLVV